MRPLQTLPDAEEFRKWLVEACGKLGVRPSRLASDSGSPVNSVGIFIKGEERELHLSTAHKLHKHAVFLSQKRGVDLPHLPMPLSEIDQAVGVEAAQ